tara:strand:- start:321148 stop:321903 length:756 start_codon:yes stop_codon:yes gene_type:complete
MHDTAVFLGEEFFKTYLSDSEGKTIVDVGAQDVNGSLRSVAPANNDYIGIDFVEGKGVDLVFDDPYTLPFDDEAADVVVCSSCFEHSEFFWLLFNDILRILKPGGLFYLNVPSNGTFHKYPVDCWRFYPDSGVALQNWGRRSGYRTILLESFIGNQQFHGWNDFVGILLKDEAAADQFPMRMQNEMPGFTNGLIYDGTILEVAKQEDQYIKFDKDPQDQKLLLFFRLQKRLHAAVQKTISNYPSIFKRSSS